MSPPIIVGIGHTAQVGKDTAATALCRDLGFRRVGFADQLKELALEADPLITSRTGPVNVQAGRGRLAWAVGGLTWDGAKADYAEVRTFLQKLGVGARKVFGEDFWVEQLLKGIKPNDKVVIPDVRFHNEADMIKAHGGLLIKLTRPAGRAKVADHVSETALNGFTGWDLTITNSGTVSDLERDVVNGVRKWLEELEKSSTEQPVLPTLLPDPQLQPISPNYTPPPPPPPADRPLDIEDVEETVTEL